MNAREKIARFIANEFLDTTEINNIPDDLDLIESGIVDSLGILRIVVFLEEEMNVVIEPEQMVPKNMSSIAAILSLVDAEPAIVE
jgi:acyl carrier protein